MNRIEGEFFKASLKSRLIALSKSPRCPLACHLAADAKTSFTPQVRASAAAYEVFPHPGGPDNSIPRSTCSHLYFPAFQSARTAASS
ncbi:hypothetical protein ASG58_22620 [Rhizobium sp. Leaf383]|nr:hypothetical protein ASG58_22620 [Rhizobium sp. Leaf383]